MIQYIVYKKIYIVFFKRSNISLACVATGRNAHKHNYIIRNFAHKSLSSSYAKLLENLFELLKYIECDYLCG